MGLKQLSISHLAVFWIWKSNYIITSMQKQMISEDRKHRDQVQNQYMHSNTRKVTYKLLNLNAVCFSLSSFYSVNVYSCHRTAVFSVLQLVASLSGFRHYNIEYSL